MNAAGEMRGESDELFMTLNALIDDENILHTNEKKQNLMHLAVWLQEMPLVRYLVERAPSLIQGRDEDGDTPFLYACMIGNMELMNYFLSFKKPVVDINEANSKKRTCLHFLADKLHLNEIQAIREKGADPNKPDADGNLPAHILLMRLQNIGIMNNFMNPDSDEINSALRSLNT